VKEAIEITTFKLVPKCSVMKFVAANKDIDAWLVKQPGFRSRRIGALDDGSIADVLLWDSAKQGKDAADRIVLETKNSPVHALINQRTVMWQIAEVNHSF
jgi:hypothetical protein